MREEAEDALGTKREKMGLSSVLKDLSQMQGHLLRNDTCNSLVHSSKADYRILAIVILVKIGEIVM